MSDEAVVTIPVLIGGPAAGQPLPGWLSACDVVLELPDGNGRPTYHRERIGVGGARREVAYWAWVDAPNDGVALAFDWLVDHAFAAQIGGG